MREYGRVLKLMEPGKTTIHTITTNALDKLFIRRQNEHY